MSYPTIKGNCPMGCGPTLFVGAGGYVTCSYLPCPSPTRASILLDFLPTVNAMVEMATGVKE